MRRGGRARRAGCRGPRGCGPCTAASTRRSSRRIVSIWPLKSWRWSWIVAAYRGDHRASGSSISCSRTRSIVKPSPAIADRLGEVDLDVVRPGQELVGRHLVDLGQPEQARHRDRALTALVGAEHRCLELQVGARLDVVQRQAPSAGGSPAGVRRHDVRRPVPCGLPSPLRCRSPRRRDH